jgi:hypothetical protein
MNSEVKGTVRYEERGQGYCDVEKIGKHCVRDLIYILLLGAYSKSIPLKILHRYWNEYCFN